MLNTLTSDEMRCILTSENITYGSDFKNIRLVCKLFRDVLNVNIPNGDVELCNPLKTCWKVVLGKDYKSFESKTPHHPWLDEPHIHYITPSYYFSPDSDRYENCVSVDILHNPKTFVRVFRELCYPYLPIQYNHKLMWLLRCISDVYKQSPDLKPITLDELGINSDPTIRRTFVSYLCDLHIDASFIKFDVKHFFPARLMVSLTIDDILSHFQYYWDPMAVISISKRIIFTDFYEKSECGEWKLKDVFISHNTLRDMEMWMFVACWSYPIFPREIKDVILESHNRTQGSAIQHNNFPFEDILRYPHNTPLVYEVDISGRKLEDVLNFQKEMLEILPAYCCFSVVDLLEDTVYNHKTLQASNLNFGVVPKEKLYNAIFNNKFGRIGVVARS